MKNIRFFPVIMFVSIIILASSCVIKKNSGDNITKIVYSFGDSSVPPQYHRSYVITATPENIHIVVDSYGNILADTTYEMNTENFKLLTDKLSETGLKNKKKTTENKGCTGGTTKSVVIFKGEKTIINGTSYICGGEAYGDLEGDIDSFSNEINKFIPDIKKLLE